MSSRGSWRCNYDGEGMQVPPINKSELLRSQWGKAYTWATTWFCPGFENLQLFVWDTGITGIPQSHTQAALNSVPTQGWPAVSPPPECGHCRGVPPHPVYEVLGIQPRASYPPDITGPALLHPSLKYEQSLQFLKINLIFHNFIYTYKILYNEFWFLPPKIKTLKGSISTKCQGERSDFSMSTMKTLNYKNF